MTVMTPEQAIVDMSRIQGRVLDSVMKATLRRGARRIVTQTIGDIAKKGIGRRLFGKKRTGLRKIVTVSRVRQEGPGAFSVEMKARGLAGMMEKGGRTQGHRIKASKVGPKGRKVLSFRASGGTGAATGEVMHPGGPINRTPSLVPNADRNIDPIERELTAVVDAALGLRAVLAGLA